MSTRYPARTQAVLSCTDVDEKNSAGELLS
jgi:hypothetical protein